MSSRSIYVIWTHPLFLESVRLLLNHSDIEFVGANSDYAAAQSEILSIRPDTILMEEFNDERQNQVMQILEACPWDVLVILISLRNNQLNMYHHEQRTVGRADDLLHLVLR
ncbi:MAG: hypothetical protein P8074_12430 [Anaerolineales bacterium]|jgi:DNA-binding NarL/FixJ family response regulator